MALPAASVSHHSQSQPKTARSARGWSPSAQQNRAAHPDWFNGAVPSFGPDNARLLIVGLAPGLKGANRTGRPFLGDYAGELLYRTLLKFGLAKGRHDPADAAFASSSSIA